MSQFFVLRGAITPTLDFPGILPAAIGSTIGQVEGSCDKEATRMAQQAYICLTDENGCPLTTPDYTIGDVSLQDSIEPEILDRVFGRSADAQGDS